jgi:hypothetical protein
VLERNGGCLGWHAPRYSQGRARSVLVTAACNSARLRLPCLHTNHRSPEGKNQPAGDGGQRPGDDRAGLSMDESDLAGGIEPLTK